MEQRRFEVDELPMHPVMAGLLGEPHLAKGWEPQMWQARPLPKEELALRVFLSEVRRRYPQVLKALRDEVYLQATGAWGEEEQEAMLLAWAERFHLHTPVILSQARHTMTAWDYKVPFPGVEWLDEYHAKKQQLRTEHAHNLPLRWYYELRLSGTTRRRKQTSPLGDRPFVCEHVFRFEYDPTKEPVSVAVRRLERRFREVVELVEHIRRQVPAFDEHRQLVAFKATVPDRRFCWLAAKQVEGLTYEEIGHRFRRRPDTLRQAIYSAAHLLDLKEKVRRRPAGRKPGTKESRPRNNPSR